MGITTIYRINETDRTINIAQSVNDTDESLHGAVLNTRMYTFDELMNQHKVFCEHTEPYDAFKDRLNSALRIDKSIEVSTDDMIARFVAEYGENVFFRGFVSAVIDLYDTERYQLLKPNDVVIAKLNRNKIQTGISERINAFFDTQLSLLSSEAYFNYNMTMEQFSLSSGRKVIAADDYTFNVFHESDNCLLTILAEIEVCCHSAECIEAQKQQKEAIYKENTKAYSAVKRDYDAYVRRYKKVLVEAGIEKYHPAEFDDFMQAKQERMEDMDKLKKRLIRNGLPTKELEDLSAKYKAEIKALAEGILDKYGFDVTAVAKIKKPRK